MLRRMNLSGGTYFVLRSRFVGKEASDPALKEFIDSALSVS